MPGKRILFSVRNFWFLKSYDSVLRLLAERGHAIHIVADRQDWDEQFPEWRRAVEALAAEYSTITFGWLPRRPADQWHELRLWSMRLLDYLRFLEPQFEQTPVLRQRAAKHVSQSTRNLVQHAFPGRRWLVRGMEAILQALDRSISPTAHLEEMLREQRPDMLMVSPLVTLGSRQGEVVRAARDLGIPSVFAAGSWDHLSSKARIRDVPDLVLVWNETQAHEAVAYHGVRRDRVIVTGAQCFDQWFDRTPSRDRETFCRHLGLPPAQPIIFYVCSSLFWGSPLECHFVEKWVEAVRTSPDERLRSASILIRPHPKRGAEWKNVNLERFDHAVVWPPFGAPPLEAQAKADYFDSLFYADAIVGLNTSAQIEGALIGRPVLTVLLPEFWDNQEGTLHFHYLLDTTGGPLRAARSMEEHLGQLAESLSDPASAAVRNRTFVESFVRPRGIEQAATDVFVTALEQVGARPVSPALAFLARLGRRCLRAVPLPLAHVLRRTPVGDGRSRQDVKKSLAAQMDALPSGRTVPVRRRAKSPPRVAPPRKLPKPTRVAKSPARPRKRLETLPRWAWSLRMVIYPVVKRVKIGELSNERLWRDARYRHKEMTRQLERQRKQQRSGRRDDGAPRGPNRSPTTIWTRTGRIARAQTALLARRLGLVKGRSM